LKPQRFISVTAVASRTANNPISSQLGEGHLGFNTPHHTLRAISTTKNECLKEGSAHSCCWLWKSPQHPQSALPRAPSHGTGTCRLSHNQEELKVLVTFRLLTCLLPSDPPLLMEGARSCGKVSFSEMLVDPHLGD